MFPVSSESTTETMHSTVVATSDSQLRGAKYVNGLYANSIYTTLTP